MSPVLPSVFTGISFWDGWVWGVVLGLAIECLCRGTLLVLETFCPWFHQLMDRQPCHWCTDAPSYVPQPYRVMCQLYCIGNTPGYNLFQREVKVFIFLLKITSLPNSILCLWHFGFAMIRLHVRPAQKLCKSWWKDCVTEAHFTYKTWAHELGTCLLPVCGFISVLFVF